MMYISWHNFVFKIMQPRLLIVVWLLMIFNITTWGGTAWTPFFLVAGMMWVVLKKEFDVHPIKDRVAMQECLKCTFFYLKYPEHTMMIMKNSFHQNRTGRENCWMRYRTRYYIWNCPKSTPPLPTHQKSVKEFHGEK